MVFNLLSIAHMLILTLDNTCNYAIQDYILYDILAKTKQNVSSGKLLIGLIKVSHCGEEV